MKLRTQDVDKLDAFLQKIERDVYPEPVSDLHQGISDQMVDRLVSEHSLRPGTRILDVGCGQGLAIAQFARHGLNATGVTLGTEDVAVCSLRGLNVREMDQSFLDFDDASFDLIWCRHCLEHSIFPYFTLTEFHRVLSPRGMLYVEVPAPDTSCAHQTNPNHYSVLGKSMWLQLMGRSGFDVVEQLDISFATGLGPDMYWAFVLRRRD